MTLLEISNLRVAYPHQSQAEIIWAVDDVSFTLNPGERMGLVGESGCGKSTLGRSIMKLLPEGSQVEGIIDFQGKSIAELAQEELRQFRGEVVALVFQDPMTRLDPLMTIGDHCLETLKAHQPELSRQAAKQKAVEALDSVRIPANRWGQYPHEFSGGMRQRVAIALALLLNPKMIVADEPTTSLDVTVSAEILEELTRLCSERDMALLLISHDLAMVGEYCDRIGVMYQGKMVESGPVKSILYHPQHEYTQSLLQAALKIQAVTAKDHQTQQAPILQVKELQQHFTLESNLIKQLFGGKKSVIKAVDGINFELHEGETLGLVGESGCGKSTLSRTILQLLKPTSGTVKFLGKDLTQLPVHQLREMRRQIQMIFQDPHACLNPLMSVGESIADPLLIHKVASPSEAKKQVVTMLEKVGLTPTSDYYHRYPAELSGGQQQRVAIARALITNPQLVICDEPVSMLDATVQTQVLELMLALKAEFQLTYLFITHDLWVARFFCDRIAVMNGGKIVEIGTTKQIFDHPNHPYTQKLLSAAPLLVS
ncbi:ATPase component of various ABC-type transport systems with duplicated ATPase domain [Xenococcus sp. PCC 7305]|uniref:dipeptide ABC transporter ATP-binding protein n=1 Tax=Xenococcus sp. PCC 7305 TaxID=102125 RepID=UPI0002AC4D57|nr:ABC transporter ATP-binding protein [Xenococcus sp. PCC 7305]ELS04192.1 ATPase component of various ABC-type transport systems with duplicated ATPase domain [Xenococcus sp. PCC 7305]